MKRQYINSVQFQVGMVEFDRANLILVLLFLCFFADLRICEKVETSDKENADVSGFFPMRTIVTMLELALCRGRLCHSSSQVSIQMLVGGIGGPRSAVPWASAWFGPKLYTYIYILLYYIIL